MSNKRTILTVVALMVLVNVVLGVRWFVASRATPSSAACVNNLRQIANAKEQWALEQQKNPDDVPDWSDVQSYLNKALICPGGGTYTLGRVGIPPKCSIGGVSHEYPRN
jgi:hypothetical protein